MLSKEQFLAQFNCRVDPDSDVFGKPLKDALMVDGEFHGITVYRCLNLLLVKKVDGNLYCSHS